MIELARRTTAAGIAVAVFLVGGSKPPRRNYPLITAAGDVRVRGDRHCFDLCTQFVLLGVVAQCDDSIAEFLEVVRHENWLLAAPGNAGQILACK